MSARLRVAFDVGPLHGHRTGIGHAVEAMQMSLAGRDDIELNPYVISARARLAPGEHRLPIPAALAHRMWAHRAWPRLDVSLRGVDLIHGTNYVVPPSRLPRVVSVYDCWFLAHPQLTHPVVARAGDVLRRAAADGARVHASSEASAEVARRLLGTNLVTAVHLAPLGVSDPPVEPPIAGLPAGRFAVSIGTQERRKNLPRLIDAFAAAIGGGLDASLVIAGAPGDDADAVTAAIARLSSRAARRIVRLGRISDATKWWLLHHATALAYPSLDEGFGFPVLEAQQLGLAVVGGDAGSIPEIGGDGVELVDPHDPMAIADALTLVLDDETHRAALVAKGSENLSRFSWASTAQGLSDLYRRAVVEHAR